MLRGIFGNLIFAIIARMLGGNHLKTLTWVGGLTFPGVFTREKN